MATIGSYKGVDIMDGQDVQQQVNTINTNTNTAPTGTAAMTPENLQAVPPTKLPTGNNAPTTGNLALATNGAVAGAQTDATYEPPENKAKGALADLYKGLYSDVNNQAAQEAKFAEDAQLAQKKQRATALSNEIDQMDKSYRDEVSAIKENPEGKFGGAIQADINRATDRYNNNRANVALTYKIAAGDFNDASAIVESKISSLRQQNAQKVELYKLAVDAVQNDLTESEKIQMQANIQQKQRQSDALQAQYSSTLNIAAQNGAPASILSAIDEATQRPGATAADIVAAAGQYGIDREAQAKLDLIRAQTASANRANQPDAPNGTVSPLTQSVIENPSLFDDLTPTVRGKVISELSALGYDTSNLGTKPLSDVAIKNISDTQKAISDLDGLTPSIEANLEFIGPISGFAALNPWSKARQLQADLDRVRQTVGKALEGGVLRKEDEEKYKKILPVMNDTIDTVRYKLAQLKTTISEDIERYQSLQLSGGRSLDVGASLQKKGETTNTAGTTSTGNSYTVTQN